MIEEVFNLFDTDGQQQLDEDELASAIFALGFSQNDHVKVEMLLYKCCSIYQGDTTHTKLVSDFGRTYLMETVCQSQSLSLSLSHSLTHSLKNQQQ